MVCFALLGWGSTHATATIADDHRPVLVGCEDPYSPAHRQRDKRISEDKVDIRRQTRHARQRARERARERDQIVKRLDELRADIAERQRRTTQASTRETG